MNHAYLVSSIANAPEQMLGKIDRLSELARKRAAERSLAWSVRDVEQITRGSSRGKAAEFLIIGGFSPLPAHEHARLCRILDDLLATVSSTHLPAVGKAQGSLVEADFIRELEQRFHNAVAAAGMRLEAVPQAAARTTKSMPRIPLTIKIALALTLLMVVMLMAMPPLFKNPKPDTAGDDKSSSGTQSKSEVDALQKLRPWGFLVTDDWKPLCDATGLNLTASEKAFLRDTRKRGEDADKSSVTRFLEGRKAAQEASPSRFAEAKELTEKIGRWSGHLQLEMHLSSALPGELESHRTLVKLQNARAVGDRRTPAGWISNFNDQRASYDNDMRYCAESLDEFAQALGKHGRPEDLRTIMDNTCLALSKFGEESQDKSGFGSRVKENGEALEPCAPGWSIPTLQDCKRLEAIKNLLSSLEFKRMAFDDADVTAQPHLAWPEVLNLCEKGRKLSDVGGETRKRFFAELPLAESRSGSP
jgi:hypothetical protein